MYDRVQNILGLDKVSRHLVSYLADTDRQIVLDVGAGTGNYNALLPRSATYIWLDNDRKKLKGFRQKDSSGLIVLGDATNVGLKNKSVDYGLCFALSHHVTGRELPLVFSELARVIRRRLIFMDAVVDPGSRTGNLLWKYDRGSHPRSVEALHSALETYFVPEHVKSFTVYHSYILWVGTPRNKG